jgi:hypothetical protein
MGSSARQLLLAVLSTLLVAITASSGYARDVGEALHAGARVRLSLKPTPDHLTRERIMGLLMSVDEDSVVVNVGPGQPSRGVAIDALQSFEVGRGRKSSAGKGAGIGLLSGAAGGVAAGLIVCGGGNCNDSGLGDATGLVAGVLGVGGGLFGLGMGALIGGRFHTDRWERVSIGDLRMGMEPSGDGVSLRLSLALP